MPSSEFSFRTFMATHMGNPNENSLWFPLEKKPLVITSGIYLTLIWKLPRQFIRELIEKFFRHFLWKSIWRNFFGNFFEKAFSNFYWNWYNKSNEIIFWSFLEKLVWKLLWISTGFCSAAILGNYFRNSLWF